MKHNTRRLALWAALLILAGAAPFLALLPGGGQTAPQTPAATARPSPTAAATTAPTPAAAQTVTVYDEALGKERLLSVEAFMVGAAACEMPPDWPDAALQAQMVASRSYAQAQSQPMTVNSAQCSGWTEESVLKLRWGDDFEATYARLQALAAQVSGAVLLYDGAPAAACYHAASCGHTEASQNVWLTALPYLQGVDSPWDRTAPDFEVTVEYTAPQLSDAVASLTGAIPQGDAAGWLGDTVWDAAGYVQSITIAGQKLTGSEVRGALGLRSACFSMAWDGAVFTVTTRGYGHGVGLSQYGAKAMAEGGSGWRDILTYYFPGTQVHEAG